VLVKTEERPNEAPLAKVEVENSSRKKEANYKKLLPARNISPSENAFDTLTSENVPKETVGSPKSAPLLSNCSERKAPRKKSFECGMVER